MAKTKYVYFFSRKKSEGNSSMKELLGGKGANLAQMSKLGLPVPPGFTISTEVCAYYLRNNHRYPQSFKKEVLENISRVEEITSKKFASPDAPLFFSVRSGARISMPGMMDTILNLGLNDQTVLSLARDSSDERFAWNSYWRFIFMYGDVVMGAGKEKLNEALEKLKKERRYNADSDLGAEDWKEMARRLKNKIKNVTGEDVPQNPHDQLWGAINAVFDSWNNPRAITYRKLNKIPDEWGTAVNIQTMVFGNFGENSGSGVSFTRDPATGRKKLYGEFLRTAQGEDVVAGIRTPKHIGELQKNFPICYKDLVGASRILENYFRDMQDIEFTIERGMLWMLQTRNGKRSAQAAVKIVTDMVEEGLISKQEALMRIDPASIEAFFRPSFDTKIKKEILAKGLPVSPGAAVGEVVFDPDDAEKLAGKGHKVILVRTETSPDDIHGMAVAEGILTSRGGFTSHAALVARGMGKPCVAGAEEIYVDYKKQNFFIRNQKIRRGDLLSLDGSLGEVYLGRIKTVPAKASGNLEKLLRWADKERRLGVYANADTAEQARQARRFLAEGIGLCRTEHMFFEESRIPAFRQMILAQNSGERRKALVKIKSFQKKDFIKIFQEMDGLPVIIRLLDPPLHEFLPQTYGDIKRFSEQIGSSPKIIAQKVEALRELNPMMGHRGCRLGICYPEIYEMQVQAIMEAACNIKKNGGEVSPEIMIPLTLDLREFDILKRDLIRSCEEIMAREKTRLRYKIGTMIELPRAALRAGEIARSAEFFSFGSNDLTQTTLGISRDDAGRFLPQYLTEKIFAEDPFVSIDQEGVGELLKIGTERGRKTRENLEVGICGEHGGDPKSIAFCHEIGLNYVSCSPFRVPTARLAAAQAAIRNAENLG